MEWLKSENNRDIWISHGLNEPIIEDHEKVDSSIFRGAGKFSAPRKTPGSDLEDIEHFLRTCSSKSSASRLLRTCSPRSNTPATASSKRESLCGSYGAWKCPFCTYQYNLTKSNYDSKVISKHLHKFHIKQVQDRVAENEKNGIAIKYRYPDLGLKQRLKPFLFTKLTKKQRLAASFPCPWCECGLMTTPSSIWLFRKSKRFHLLSCSGAAGRTSLNENHNAFKAMKRQKFWAGSFAKRKEALKMKCLRRAQERGHNPVAIKCKFPYKNAYRMQHLYFCKTCRQSNVNIQWKRSCPGKVIKTLRKGPPPGINWRRSFTKVNGVKKMIEATETDPAEADVIRKALRNKKLE